MSKRKLLTADRSFYDTETVCILRAPGPPLRLVVWPAGCHPDLAPHRWSHYALALAHGLNPNAALDVAGLRA